VLRSDDLKSQRLIPFDPLSTANLFTINKISNLLKIRVQAGTSGHKRIYNEKEDEKMSYWIHEHTINQPQRIRLTFSPGNGRKYANRNADLSGC
jgi:hypothetical protein